MNASEKQGSEHLNDCEISTDVRPDTMAKNEPSEDELVGNFDAEFQGNIKIKEAEESCIGFIYKDHPSGYATRFGSRLNHRNHGREDDSASSTERIEGKKK